MKNILSFEDFINEAVNEGTENTNELVDLITNTYPKNITHVTAKGNDINFDTILAKIGKTTIAMKWRPSEWNTAVFEKHGKTFKMFLNGSFLGEFSDMHLEGQGRLGLHTYGPRAYDSFLLEK